VAALKDEIQEPRRKNMLIDYDRLQRLIGVSPTLLAPLAACFNKACKISAITLRDIRRPKCNGLKYGRLIPINGSLSRPYRLIPHPTGAAYSINWPSLNAVQTARQQWRVIAGFISSTLPGNSTLSTPAAKNSTFTSGSG
jgi:hypothetical protein